MDSQGVKPIEAETPSPSNNNIDDGSITKDSIHHEEGARISISHSSDGECQKVYPEGGTRAWLSVLGSLCGMMCCFGLIYTIGTFQTYLAHNQLRLYSTADVGWIFGVYLFIAYFSGIQTGPLFDAQGPKVLMGAGSTCLVLTMFLLGVCKGLLTSPSILLKCFSFSSYATFNPVSLYCRRLKTVVELSTITHMTSLSATDRFSMRCVARTHFPS